MVLEMLCRFDGDMICCRIKVSHNRQIYTFVDVGNVNDTAGTFGGIARGDIDLSHLFEGSDDEWTKIDKAGYTGEFAEALVRLLDRSGYDEIDYYCDFDSSYFYDYVDDAFINEPINVDEDIWSSV